MKSLCVEEGNLITCNIIIWLEHFKQDLCHPSVYTAGSAVITHAPPLQSRKALPLLSGGSSGSHEAKRGFWVRELVSGGMKISSSALQQCVLLLPWSSWCSLQVLPRAITCLWTHRAGIAHSVLWESQSRGQPKSLVSLGTDAWFL